MSATVPGDALGRHRRERGVQQLGTPLELACHLIEVRTDDGYDPTMDDLVAELTPPEWEAGASRFVT